MMTDWISTETILSASAFQIFATTTGGKPTIDSSEGRYNKKYNGVNTMKGASQNQNW